MAEDRLEDDGGKAHQGSREPRHGLDRFGPTHRYGTNLFDIFDHSWCRVPVTSWRWIPKLLVLGDLGFLTRRGEVRSFEATTRVVR